MLKDILQNFLPWILYSFLASSHPELAILLAALTAIVLEIQELKEGYVLSWGTLLFFIFMFISVLIFHSQWVVKHIWILSNSALAAITWISILVRRPFTMQYARKDVSVDKWQHPLFIRINYILTISWGLVFLFSVMFNVIEMYFPKHANFLYDSISYLLPLIGIVFTTWFPDWYKKRSTALFDSVNGTVMQ